MGWLETLMDNAYAWAIISLIAVISFIYAIICQCKNKEKKEFSYARKSYSLIRKKKSKFEKLEIKYNGQAIGDLCVSKFVIWNSGNRTLNFSDMVPNKEIIIEIEGENKILDTEIIFSSETANAFKIKKIDEKHVKICFDYVDNNDGVVIQIIHTGLSDDINISCKIKGGKELKSFVSTLFDGIKFNIPKKFSSVYLFFVTLLMSFLTAFLFISNILIKNGIVTNQNFIDYIYSNDSTKVSPLLMIILFIMLIFMLFLSFKMIKSEFLVGIPRKIKKVFLEDFE